MIHIVKSFGIVNKADIDVFLEPSCFFDDPADVGNLISGSSAFSKTSLNIRLAKSYFRQKITQEYAFALSEYICDKNTFPYLHFP